MNIGYKLKEKLFKNSENYFKQLFALSKIT